MNMGSLEFIKVMNRKDFFKDITFEDTESKKHAVDWLSQIYKYHHITFSSFKEIFVNIPEITFPLTVQISYSHMNILDANNTNYYVIFCGYGYKEIHRFVAGLRGNIFDKSWTFEITSGKNSTAIITKVESSFLQLHFDKTNTEIILEYSYDVNSTTCVLQFDYYPILSITYPSAFNYIEKDLTNYIFNLYKDNDYFNNVFTIFRDITELIGEKEVKYYLRVISTIPNDEKRVLSKVIMRNGIVEQTCYTEVLTETEMATFFSNKTRSFDNFISLISE